MSRKATAGRPGVPGAFSGPSKGARWLHNSSGICHIVGTAVLVNIASLPYSWEVYPIKIALSGFRTDSYHPVLYGCVKGRVWPLWLLLSSPRPGQMHYGQRQQIVGQEKQHIVTVSSPPDRNCLAPKQRMRGTKLSR